MYFKISKILFTGQAFSFYFTFKTTWGKCFLPLIFLNCVRKCRAVRRHGLIQRKTWVRLFQLDFTSVLGWWGDLVVMADGVCFSRAHGSCNFLNTLFIIECI